MSGWKIILRELHAAGGGPIKRIDFDRSYAGGFRDYAYNRLKQFKLVTSKKRGDGWYWELTKLGWDVQEKRAAVVKEPGKSAGNRRDIIVATGAALFPMVQNAGNHL